jgi:hypothetical protein
MFLRRLARFIPARKRAAALAIVHMIKIRWPHHVFVSKSFEVTGAIG